MQIYMLAMFMLAGSALLSLDISFVVYVFLLFMLISASIVMLTYISEDDGIRLSVKELRSILVKTLPIPLISLPVAVLLFAVLPRTNYPVFEFLSRDDTSLTGFTDSVALGSVSQIQEDARLIFRAETDFLSDNMLYWRGIVMDRFDGRDWRASEGRYRSIMKPPVKTVEQTIYLEPYGDKYLFGLDAPLHMDMRGSSERSGFVYTLRRAPDKRIQYDVISAVDKYRKEFYRDYGRFMELPELSPELASFADTFSERSGEELAGYLQVYFMRNGFKYSLEKLPVSDKPLEDFLFKLKSGNCEYYASASAVILRRNGVPARLVGGYRGGYYNNAAGYYAVPQRNAHVWVEAFIEGQGWLRVDPTPAASGIFGAKNSFSFRMRMLFDTINFYWNALVINYDFSKQVKALTGAGDALNDARRNFGDILLALLRYALYLIPPILLWLLGRVLRFRITAGDKAFAKSFRNVMEKKGIRPHISEGLSEIAKRSAEPAALEFAEIFHGAFYRGRKLTPQERARLKELLSELKSA
jgi:transglutaminase-like putative cysteine protease